MIKKLILALTLVVMLANTSCKARYPDLDDGLYAEFVTSKDTMVAKLFFEDVPTTVANFVALAEGKHPMVDEKYKGKPFYNGLTFHRVMNDFMIQGGDPLGTGIGDPGYKFGDEFRPHLKHDKPGILAMANSGPQSNGSQFYITEKATPWLDAFKPDGTLKKCGAFPGGSCHAVFGELVIGLDVQDEISNVAVDGRSKPKEDVIIKQVNIIRKGKAAIKFDAPKVFKEELPKIEENMAKYTAQAEKAAAESKQVAEQQAQLACKSFLENNANLKGERIESKTGMAMIFTKKGNGKQPKATDRVFVDCAGYFENGELFWTTKKDVAKKNNKYDEQQDKRNMYKPFDRAYNENAGLIAGFKEAMLNMKIGDKARVFIPYYLGYGEKGSPPVIPPNSNLIFDIELVSIK